MSHVQTQSKNSWKKVMKNTNQWDRNDPHKVTKLVEEEWDEMNTRLTKYDQNSGWTLGWNCLLDIVW
jgi:hypothetical protein